MKKSICVALCCTILLGVFALLPAGVSAKAKPRLSKTSLSIIRTKTYTLKLKNAKAGKIKWASSKKSVAAVSGGKITALKIGKAKIVAKYNGKKYYCKVNVKPRVTAFGKVFNVYTNDTIKLVLKNKKNSSYNAKSWTSSNSKIASISSKGVVSGKKEGTITITATNNYGDKIKGTVKVLNPYKTLKDYIKNNGKRDKEGNTYIAYGSDKYSFFITYNSKTDEFEFQGDYDGDSGNFEAIMYMNASGSDTQYIESYYLSDDRLYSYNTKSQLNASTFTSKTKLDFIFLSGNISEAKASEYSNIMLQDSFSGWKYMLNDKLKMGLSALGFSSY